MDTREKTIDELLTRSVASVLPSREDLKKILLSDKKLRIYIGADATGPQLHLGHATNFLLLEKLRQLGHEVIVLFGDFTAMLGDPTDKSAARVQLSKDEVEKNIRTWKSQLEKILDFDDSKNPARIERNSAWLASLDFAKVIELSANFTVQQMLERDMFERRLKEEKPIYMHEFFYPLMQGYDSVALNVDIEIGGTDQTFNMLAGRTLLRHYRHKEKFVIATTLLEHPVTKKKLMSKSEGNYIALDDVPNDMFGKAMALPDGIISQMFMDCTVLPLEEVRMIEEELQKGSNPRDLKIKLAKELVKLYHGKEAAEAAEAYFITTFSEGKMPDDIRPVVLEEGLPLLDALVRSGTAKSKAEARRKIEQGGVELNGEKVREWSMTLNAAADGAVVKVGKKDFFRIAF